MPLTTFTPRDGEVTHGLTVSVITDAQAFHGLRDEWTALLADSSAASPFLTWEWLYAWWTHLRDARALHLLTARCGGRLVGVAPLSVARGRFSWPSRLEFLGIGWAGSDYLDVIARVGFEARCADAFSAAVQSRRLSLHL